MHVSDSFGIFSGINRRLVSSLDTMADYVPGGQVTVQSPLGFHRSHPAESAHLFVISDTNAGVPRCEVAQVSPWPAPLDPATGITTITPAPAFTNPYPQGSCWLINLGPNDRVRKVLYDVSGNVVRRSDLMVPGVPVPNPIVSNVVLMKAQYGLDNDADGFIDTWTSARNAPWSMASVLALPRTAPPGVASLNKIKAIRLAIVVRSSQFERPQGRGRARDRHRPDERLHNDAFPLQRAARVHGRDAERDHPRDRELPLSRVRAGHPAHEPDLEPDMIARALPQRRLQPPSRQRGIVVFIALIAVVLMSLAAVALMRSVHTNTLVVGNIAFRQAAQSMAAAAVETGGLRHVPADGADRGSQGSRPCPQLLRHLQPDRMRWACRPLLQGDVSGFAGQVIRDRTDATAMTARYVIERMCDDDALGLDATQKDCEMIPPKQSPAKEANLKKGIVLPRIPYYRMTVRVDGPGNSVAFSQAMLR